MEIQAAEIEVLGTADPEEYPLQKKGHSLEFLREIAHLRPRTNTFGAVLRVRHALAFAVHQYFNDHGFYYVHTPIITGSDAEGAGQMFRVTTLPPEHPPRTADGSVDLHRRLLRQANQPHRVGPAGGRSGRHGPGQGVHFRAHVPGRKLQHSPPPGRVLDD